MNRCRACGKAAIDAVIDLGSMPPSDLFPPADQPLSAAEVGHRLVVESCRSCGLVQLAPGGPAADEPRGVEPQSLRDQASAAVACVAAAGLLDGGSVIAEYGSPHGGSWLGLFDERGYRRARPGEVADVVVDSMGLMHEADVEAAIVGRSERTAMSGTLLLQFHSIAAIVRHGQWNAFRHGHYAYFSLTALRRLLASVHMDVVRAWTFPLYGGSVLVAARHGGGGGAIDPSVARVLREEEAAQVTTVDGVRPLADAFVRQTGELRRWAEATAASGRCIYGYAAASRATSLFYAAGLRAELVPGIGDASKAKQGRRMPGTDIPILAPDEVVAAEPAYVFLTVPDMRDEVARRHPEIAARILTEPPRG